MPLVGWMVEDCALQAPETLSAQPTSFGEPVRTGGKHADGSPRKHFKTEGENRFNWRTYTGLGYFANVAISLGAVYWAERTHSGHWLIDKVAKGFGKLGVPMEKTAFIARKSFFLAGGFAVIPFMKGLENHKAELVKQYNRDFYGARADTDPTIIESEREVEQAPKQGWASIISGRALALVPFYATIGLLWNQTSKLSLVTNPEFAKLGKVGREALHKIHPEKYAEMAGQGKYIDRPISELSRDLGKLAASRGKYFDGKQAGGLKGVYYGALSLLGKPLRMFAGNEKAVATIEQMGKEFPGALQSVTSEAKSDPIHAALPYYVISEAITSALVAWGLFVITRVTGPFFDKKPHAAETAQQPQPISAPAQRTEPASTPAPTTTIAAKAAVEGRLQASPATALAH